MLTAWLLYYMDDDVERGYLPSIALSCMCELGREWVERLTTLAVDKHLEVRRTAEQALARVHSLVDSSVLHEHLDAVDLASDIRTTLLQILQVLFNSL